ncbi:hypothetical protein QU39_00105 [Staphylococcus aureus]|nr:hypothetical protein QU39_00105 [Staphylococcus aureus]
MRPGVQQLHLGAQLVGRGPCVVAREDGDVAPPARGESAVEVERGAGRVLAGEHRYLDVGRRRPRGDGRRDPVRGSLDGDDDLEGLVEALAPDRLQRTVGVLAVGTDDQEHAHSGRRHAN